MLRTPVKLARGRGALISVAVALGLALAPPAGATVRETPRVVIVHMGDARAVVTREPFRIAFQTASGRTVLRQLARRGRPVRVPPTEDPEPFSLERKPDRAVYAPLAFEVGRERREQWNASFWAGNLLFARHQGIVHFARRLLSVRRDGGGARLVVATTDRSRRLVVRILPDRGAAVRVLVRPTSSRGIVAFADSFASGRDEAFHGFGGRHWGVDQRGHKLYGWIEQENIGGPATLNARGLAAAFVEQGTDFTFAQLGAPDLNGPLTGGDRHYMFPGGPGAAYYAQNVFVSSRPYAFLLNRDELTRWRMANDRADAWQVQASAGGLDYTVAVGPPRRAMAAISAINGRHRLPPAWAHGPIVWRANNNTGRETPQSYREKIEQDLADIARLDPPLSAYAFEGWGLLNDDTYVRGVIERLHARGIKAVLYVRAFVADDALRTQSPTDVQEVKQRRLVARRPDGSPFFFDVSGSPAMLLDFTNPGTREWFDARVRRMLDLGADGFMEDFGEQTMDGMRFNDGSTGAQMHNRMAVLYHRTGDRAIRRWERSHPGRGPIWMFNRAGWSGRPGSAAYEQGNFPGDETIDWSEASGLASLAPDMLNRAVGGAFGYTTDIGGYVDLLTGPTDSELFTRWSEWAALTPYFRVHNSPNGPGSGTRFPWSFDQATYDRWVAMAALHRRATSLIRRLWAAGRRTGLPPTRPLWLAFPGDRRAAAQDQQWMLGDHVLVAPVVTQGATGRTVYFPEGCWTHPETRERFRGPAARRVDAPLGRLPYFFRCGRTPF
jgi:alpha-glucosidase (family GH31 glycosyl hydrolase)